MYNKRQIKLYRLDKADSLCLYHMTDRPRAFHTGNSVSDFLFPENVLEHTNKCTRCA